MTLPAPDSVGSPPRLRRRAKLPRGEFATLYLVAVILGSAGVRFHIMLPVLVMGLYLAYGLPRAVRGNVLLEFTDSFYYLGFTITVASLLLAMAAFSGEGSEPRSVQNVLQHYATGLATTVVGIIGRTALQLFFLAPDETAEARAREVTKRTEEFIQSLEGLNARLTTMLSSTFETLQGDVARTLATVEQELQGLSASVQRLATSVADVKIDPSGMIGAFGTIEGAAERAIAALDASLARYAAVQQQLDQTGPRLTRLGQELDGLRHALGGALAAAQGFEAALPQPQLAALGPTLTMVTQRLTEVTDALREADWKALGPSSRSLTTALKGLQTAVSSLDVGGLKTALSDGEAALQRFQQGLAGVGLPHLKTTVDSAAGAIEQFRQAVGRSIGALDGLAAGDPASLARLQDALRATARHVEAVDIVLREIADAVRLQVARL